MRKFTLLILFSFQSILFFSQEKTDTLHLYREIRYSVNHIYKSKEALPDSILKLIPKELILFADKKALQKLKKQAETAEYKQIFLIVAFGNFFLINCRHYEAGSHDHVMLFSYRGNLLLDMDSGYNMEETFELLQRELVRKGRFEVPTCGESKK